MICGPFIPSMRSPFGVPVTIVGDFASAARLASTMTMTMTVTATNATLTVEPIEPLISITPSRRLGVAPVIGLLR
jgi:hypothetical protein